MNLSRLCERSELGFVCELVRQSSAVKQTDVVVRDGERMTEHRAQGRNPGPARDEDKTAFERMDGKGERPDGAFDIDARADGE